MTDKNDIKFMHVRFCDDHGNIRPQGGVTYAYREREDGVIEFGRSFCHFRDNFRKSYGRDKAAGRLTSLRHREIFPGDMGAFRTAIQQYRITINEAD